MEYLANTVGEVSGDFVSFEQTTNEVFWTTLPQGFAFAMIVWLMSLGVGIAFKIVKLG